MTIELLFVSTALFEPPPNTNLMYSESMMRLKSQLEPHKFDLSERINWVNIGVKKPVFSDVVVKLNCYYLALKTLLNF